jgi:hypothetical protein
MENLNKKAFFVIGAESSGTRVLTQAFIAAGCWGDGGHAQRLDDLNFNDRPPIIVFRRSLPHANKWPKVADLKRRMEGGGYEVKIVGIERDPNFVMLSQLRNRQHSRTKEEASEKIGRATRLVKAHADEIVKYPYLVNDPWYRKQFFEKHGLIEPAMHFYNGDAKYEHNMA